MVEVTPDGTSPHWYVILSSIPGVAKNLIMTSRHQPSNRKKELVPDEWDAEEDPSSEPPRPETNRSLWEEA